MMFLLKFLVGCVALLVATSSSSCVNGETLRGGGVVGGDGGNTTAKPVVQIYHSGGDLKTGIVLMARVASIIFHPCGEQIHWEWVPFGVSRERSDGSFTCVDGANNCEYLEALNCFNSLIPKDPSKNWEVAQSLLWITVMARSGVAEIKKMFPDTVDILDKCMKTQGKHLMHQAAIKTKKNVQFHMLTFNVAVTIEGQQDMNIWRKDFKHVACDLTKLDVCCNAFPEETDDMMMMSSLFNDDSSSSSLPSSIPHHITAFFNNAAKEHLAASSQDDTIAQK